ncbi:MAG: dipicolinate synthase [Clostridia bacterium]|nr:dipicolinate synthase [Clostridia bacterium]
MKFLFIGGDMRIASLASLLYKEGHDIACYALDEAPALTGLGCALSLEDSARSADCIVLPLPVSNIRGGLNAPLSAHFYSIEDILRRLPAGSLVCAGRPDDVVKSTAAEFGLDMVDYFAREELVALNALATAEGAISVLLTHSPITIWDSDILICGYGRIGKMLAERLRALGARVAVSARKAGDFAYIRAMGCEALDTRKLGEELARFDTIINTVPARILGGERLSMIKHDALVLDLASRPGGVDFEAARALDLNVLWALGLPADTAPVTAGKIIKETLLNILGEKRGGL